jgi:hypothetical protein
MPSHLIKSGFQWLQFLDITFLLFLVDYDNMLLLGTKFKIAANQYFYGSTK